LEATRDEDRTNVVLEESSIWCLGSTGSGKENGNGNCEGDVKSRRHPDDKVGIE
jgi:hypothetical protein